MEQIDILANFIMAEIDGEPSRNEGAGNTAIRIIKALRAKNKQLKDKRHITLTQAREAALFSIEKDRQRQTWADSQVENERLKEALKEIKAIEDMWDNCIPECNVCLKVQDIAEQALKEDS